jgi:mRNA interferase YafQ
MGRFSRVPRRGDFLLVYQLTERNLIFVDLGTHAELFK